MATYPDKKDMRTIEVDKIEDRQHLLKMSMQTLVDSISNIRIGDTQSKTERTPLDTIPLPMARGSVEVDENVIKGVPRNDNTTHRQGLLIPNSM